MCMCMYATQGLTVVSAQDTRQQLQSSMKVKKQLKEHLSNIPARRTSSLQPLPSLRELLTSSTPAPTSITLDDIDAGLSADVNEDDDFASKRPKLLPF